MLVGAAVPPRPPDRDYLLSDMDALLTVHAGALGHLTFSLGCIGAGFSSALIMPMMATLGVETMLGLKRRAGLATQQELRLPAASVDALGTGRGEVPTSAFTANPFGGRCSCGEARMLMRWARLGRASFVMIFVGLALIPSLLRLLMISVITAAQVSHGVIPGLPHVLGSSQQ